MGCQVRGQDHCLMNGFCAFGLPAGSYVFTGVTEWKARPKGMGG